MSNHVESLYSAVLRMAGHGTIKERLVAAFEENLDYIEEYDLPEDVRPEFSELRRMMTRVAPLNGEGPMCASVRKMSIGEADECAGLMVGIYSEMLRLGDPARPRPSAEADEKSKVPAFLVKSG